MSITDRIEFASRMLRKQLDRQSTACPYCASEKTVRVARKQLLLELRECELCGLTFRYPKDDLDENFDFYQEHYKQDIWTDLPTEAELERHLANNFRDINRDMSEHLALIRQFSTGNRLLDFGASWGYCTWQFQQAGYDAVGFEISHPRANYGQKMLNVSMVNSTNSLPDQSIDVIYASHVLEHLPDLGTTLREFRRLLAKDGHVFIFVPNGAGVQARRLGVKWPPLINQKHVTALTPRFFAYSLSSLGLLPKFASSPYDAPPRPFDPAGPHFDGEELLAIGTAS
jgi:2-polyprenyl-3-methyl-5-hydroxy-6-metoxy-1,4-benzoquinol methylase